MLGVTLQIDEHDQYLDLMISTQLIQKPLDLKVIRGLIDKSEFKEFFIFDENIFDAITNYKAAIKSNKPASFTTRVGERRQNEIKCRIQEDDLAATLTVTRGYAGKPLTVETLMQVLKDAKVVKGIGQKRIKRLVMQCNESRPGDVCEELVAKGLPPRNGRPSKLQPLVQNALERILRPQQAGNTRVDMRNLGDVICVKKGTELLRRLAPTEGRTGYSITGAKIRSKSGEWLKFRPGEGTIISDKDENLLLADISGMPKFKDQKMWVDDTFISKGVNVGSGNVNYDGAVLVNGDVTEKMQIIATGDVTINGFVESAYIQAGGDIIITEGAMGKVNDSATQYSTTLKAKGSVHVQHGQGLDISCNGNVTIGRQLAYSRITCKGEVSVGAIDNPNGNIFGCVIKCQNKVIAGTLGAISGSNLSVDFSDGFNSLLERKDTLDELLRQIKQNNNRHKERMNVINTKMIPEDMKGRVDEANELVNNETHLLQWLESKASEMKKLKDNYQNDIKLIANKRLYPGVIVKLNNRTWRAEREYDRAKIVFEGHQWQYEPLI
ncbi:DUF342 domain-containing protein [Paraglaciecola hydrolytica]|uniref:Flagellar Assembly Protein A N-terminal region domain-containing protein n=1 Tax=Paraglaciecola hydrolytica TaxID=1799789 RepID=A0A136A6H4_9ALTE|nr:FapA family protein [Paraglaciecola hydrolytica]KXI30826.1 hypothetical protein AX660_05295 [Paraglaciecola hydrolytica]